ncbi:MAG: carbohydrate ABC transporter permease [Canibacter sp.]
MTQQTETRALIVSESKTRKSGGRGQSKLLVELLLLLLTVVTLVPVFWTIVLAFLPNRAIVSSKWDFPFWFGNFTRLFRDEVFIRQVLNSAMIVVGTVVICLALGALAGYALSKLNPPKWLTIPSLVIAAFIPLVPPMTLVPGLYLFLNEIGLLGGVGGLIVVNAFFNVPFAVLMLSSYFGAIPDELKEAAVVDGASDARVFSQVMLPLVKPGLSAVGIFVGIMAWNEFLMGLTLTSGGDTAPVTVGIAGLLQPYAVTWGELSAAGTVAAVPIIIMALFANRQIVAGLTSGAVKG